MKSEEKKERIEIREAFHLNWRAIGIWWKHYPLVFLSSAAFSLVNALTPYVGIWLSARIINELAGARDPNALLQLVIAALVSAALLSFLKAVTERWRNAQHAEKHVKVYKILTDKFLTMDFCLVDAPHTQDLYAQIRQNMQWSGWGIRRIPDNFEAVINALCQIAGAAALSVSLFTQMVPESAGTLVVFNHPSLVCVLILPLLAVTILSPILTTKADSYYASCADGAKKGNRTFGFYGFMGYDRRRALDIRMYCQNLLCQKYFLHSDNVFTTKGLLAKFARGKVGGLYALSSALSYVLTGLIYVYVCLKAYGGAFGVGSVTQYVGAITSLTGGMTKLLTTLGEMYTNTPFLRTAFEFLDIPNQMYQGSLTVEKRSDRNYEIEFRDVSFRYPNTGAWALRHVSARFRVGERLAIVGKNGSGKTTFIKLLCRLYDPSEGEILLNGIDIKKYNYQEYLSVFSVVFQDFQLLPFSLGQNTAAAAQYDAGRAETALQEAGLGKSSPLWKNGLETVLYKQFDDNGVEVSGGEAQKVAIARALYKDAPFIVLDEPTAALDPIAEAEIYEKFNEIVGDKTAIYISHRLSSCRFCDEIMVFDHGSVVQQGTHEALAADEAGIYHQLWNAQAQYYQ